MNWGEKKKKKERESNEENLDGKYFVNKGTTTCTQEYNK